MPADTVGNVGFVGIDRNVGTVGTEGVPIFPSFVSDAGKAGSVGVDGSVGKVGLTGGFSVVGFLRCVIGRSSLVGVCRFKIALGQCQLRDGLGGQHRDKTTLDNIGW